MDAGRSIPLWNVPASGLFDMIRGPNGEDTQADCTGGSIGALTGSRVAAEYDVCEVSLSATTSPTIVQRLKGR
jgi:hypothetical protein